MKIPYKYAINFSLLEREKKKTQKSPLFSLCVSFTGKAKPRIDFLLGNVHQRRRSRKKFIIASDFTIPNLQNPSLSSSSSSRTRKEKNPENPIMLPFRLSVIVLFLLVSLLLPPFCLCIQLFPMRPNDGGDGLRLGLDGLSRFAEAPNYCNRKECPPMDCWK